MKAIPTKYGGRQYRSRLEARWAAMFEKLEWEYEYEPLDLDGWIPDFILPRPGLSSILVEVKPFTSSSEFYETNTITKIRNAVCSTSYAQNTILLLGCTIPKESELFHESTDCAIGWFAFGEESNLGLYPLHITWPNPDKFDAYYVDEYGWVHSFLDPNLDYKDILHSATPRHMLSRLWNIAGNDVQYKRPRG